MIKRGMLGLCKQALLYISVFDVTCTVTMETNAAIETIQDGIFFSSNYVSVIKSAKVGILDLNFFHLKFAEFKIFCLAFR